MTEMLLLLCVGSWIWTMWNVYWIFRIWVIEDVRRVFAEEGFVYYLLPKRVAMTYGWRHQFRWTKAKWVAWVNSNPPERA